MDILQSEAKRSDDNFFFMTPAIADAFYKHLQCCPCAQPLPIPPIAPPTTITNAMPRPPSRSDKRTMSRLRSQRTIDSAWCLPPHQVSLRQMTPLPLQYQPSLRNLIHFTSLPAVAPPPRVHPQGVERASAMLSALARDPQNLHTDETGNEEEEEETLYYLSIAKHILSNPADDAFAIAVNFSTAFIINHNQTLCAWAALAQNTHPHSVALLRHHTRQCPSSNDSMHSITQTLCTNSSTHAVKFLSQLKLLYSDSFLNPDTLKQLCKNTSAPTLEWIRAFVAHTLSETNPQHHDDKLALHLDLEALSANPGGLHILHTYTPHLIDWNAVHDNPSRGAIQLLFDHFGDAVNCAQNKDESEVKCIHKQIDCTRLARNPHALQFLCKYLTSNELCKLRPQFCANNHPLVSQDWLFQDPDVIAFDSLNQNNNSALLATLFVKYPHFVDFQRLATNTNPNAIYLLQHHPRLFTWNLPRIQEIALFAQRRTLLFKYQLLANRMVVTDQ